MAIELIDKIAPKNDGFTGMVDADQVIGGGAAGTLPDACVASSTITQHEDDIDHDQLTNFTSNEHFTEASITHTNITAGDGSDHADVVTNTTHRGLTDNPHSVTQEQIGSVLRLGDNNTYILVTPGSNKIEIYLNSQKVYEWS